MTLPTWFRIHAAVTLPFAVPMLLAPQWTLELLSSKTVTELSVDLFRLLGAAYALITMLTWAASRLDRRSQVAIAKVLCIYESIGVLVGLTINIVAAGTLGRVITIGFFSVFALGYLWFGFLEPRRRPPAPATA